MLNLLLFGGFGIIGSRQRKQRLLHCLPLLLSATSIKAEVDCACATTHFTA